MGATSSIPWMIADVGGTHTRCALVTHGSTDFHELHVYDNADHDSLKALLETHLRHCGARRPKRAAFAVAAPISGDDVQMINLDWRFNRQSLANDLNLDSLQIINDFHAVACALPEFDDSKRIEIGASTQYRDGHRSVLGPGTGCGVAASIGGTVMSGEGGHVTLPAANDREAELIAKIREWLGHCSVERVLSGPGLLALHYSMHGIEFDDPAKITAAKGDPACDATMAQFFDFLATVSADLALTTGTTGGVFIAGGIVPKCVDRLDAASFRRRFEDKGRYREYMQAIPTYVVTDSYPGLTGLAAYVGTE